MPENFDWQDDRALIDREEVVDHLMELAEAAYDAKEQELGHPEQMRQLERIWMLRVMDRLWIQHLTAIDDLREGIGLRAYGQRDPLIEYKVEAARMFDDLQAASAPRSSTRSTTCRCARAGAAAASADTRRPSDHGEDTPTATPTAPHCAAAGRAHAAAADARQRRRAAASADPRRAEGRPQRPCPCGSGKKYKMMPRSA